MTDATRLGEIKITRAKDNFAFSKSRRFSPVKILNQHVSYEPRMSDFDRILKESPKRAS